MRMRLSRKWAVALLFVIMLLDATAPSSASDPQRLIVVFSGSGVPPDAVTSIHSAGGTVRGVIPELGIVIIEAIGIDSDLLARRLRNRPEVVGVGPDISLVLSDPATLPDVPLAEGHIAHPLPTFSEALPADFFYTSSPQQWSVKRIGAQGGGVPGGSSPGAWDVTFGAGVIIAFLDSGISPTHPDISANLLAQFSLVSPSDCDTGTAIDQAGHGTWVASLAAGAKGIGTGLMIGVAPEAKIISIKVLRRTPVPGAASLFTRCRVGPASGFLSDFLDGIVLAVQQGANIINIASGAMVDRSTPEGGALLAAFNRAAAFANREGVFIVASAGNGNLDLDNLTCLPVASGGCQKGSWVHLPSDAPNTISVIATTNPDFPPTGCPVGTDCRASYSNYGSSLHGLAAPGGNVPGGGCAFGGSPCSPTGLIRAACSPGIPGAPIGLPPGGSFGCFELFSPPATGASQHSWYAQQQGTSAAAAIVSGAAALVMAANPGIRPSQVRTRLFQTAEDLGKPGYDQFFNFGLVNACRAVASVSCP